MTATAATPVTTPADDTVASAGLDVAHVDVLVTFCVVPSDIVAVAANCDEAPTAGTAPVTVSDETVVDGEMVEDEHATRKAVNPAMITNEVKVRNIDV